MTDPPITACAACTLTTLARCPSCPFYLDFRQVNFNPLTMRRATPWDVLGTWSRLWPGRPISEIWLQEAE